MVWLFHSKIILILSRAIHFCTLTTRNDDFIIIFTLSFVVLSWKYQFLSANEVVFFYLEQANLDP